MDKIYNSFLSFFMGVVMGVVMGQVRKVFQIAATGVVLTVLSLIGVANEAFAKEVGYKVPRNVELADLDLTGMLPSVCVVSNSKGTALDKYKAAFTARGQRTVLSADRLSPTRADGVVYTADFGHQVAKGTYQEGYVVELNTPKDAIASKICWSGVSLVTITDWSGVIPGGVNLGNLGDLLTTARGHGSYVALSGRTVEGTLFVVRFDANGEGVEFLADGAGNHVVQFLLVNAGYSSKLTDRDRSGFLTSQQGALPSAR